MYRIFNFNGDRMERGNHTEMKKIAEEEKKRAAMMPEGRKISENF